MKSHLESLDIFSDTLIITVNERLARSIESVSPVLSWENFLSQLWNEIALVMPLPKVLSEGEALWLWEKIIREISPEVFQMKETAKRALQTFNGSMDYDLSFSEGSTETLAYKRWEAKFLAEKSAQQDRFCLSSERLKILSLLLEEASIFKAFAYFFPQRIYLKGFEIFTPAQKKFFERLMAQGTECVFEDLSALPSLPPQTYACLSVEDEFRQALAFMKDKVSNDPSLRVAIVVPNLPDYYVFLKRIAQTYLGNTPYVISAGLPLNQTPWVQSALSRLRLQTVYFPEARLSMHLDRFLKILKADDWLSEKILSSISYQMVQALFTRMEVLARESGWIGILSVQEALDYLTQALEVPFQEEDHPQAQIFILGMLEAAPLSFDVLWFCEASNEMFPPKPDPNPFIPYELQRALKMPRSSAEREEELARKLIHRIGVNNKIFVVSYSRFSEGIRQERSKIFEEMGSPVSVLLPQSLEILKEYQSQNLQFYTENTVSEVCQNEIKRLKGGATILVNHAACPFKAFARNRLKVEPFEPDTPYFLAKDRGTLIHEVLAKFWAKVGSSAALHQLNEESLRQLLIEEVDAVLALMDSKKEKISSSQKVLEKEYVVEVLTQWLNFEKTRPPFEVKLLEKELSVWLAGLPLKLRVDRVDLLLPEKRTFLLDYKTGRSRLEEWMGDRIESPQLPLYATSMSVDGLGFADVSGRMPSLSGIVRENTFSEVMEGVVTVDQLKNSTLRTFNQLVEGWKASLEKMANAFMKGEVQVDPLETACRYCRLESLCRVEQD